MNIEQKITSMEVAEMVGKSNVILNKKKGKQIWEILQLQK